MKNPNSKIERVSHRGRETTTQIMESHEAAYFADGEGGMKLQLIRLGQDGKPLESYIFHLCPEDTAQAAREATAASRSIHLKD